MVGHMFPITAARPTVMLAVYAVLMAVGPNNSVQAEEGLLRRWSFRADSVHGKTAKAVAGNREATIHGATAFESSEPRALRFSGSDQPRNYVSIKGSIGELGLPQRTISVEGWVKIDRAVEWGGIAGVIQDNGSYERGWLLGYRGSAFFFAVSTRKTSRLTYLTNHNPYELGHWYHVLGTYDGQVQKLYVDGKLVAQSTTQQGDIFYPKKVSFSIGAYHDDDEFHGMTGAIEQISLWNRALTEREIKTRFETRKTRFPGIEPVHPKVDDWPTYARDNQRTGISQEELKFPLRLKWVHKTGPAPQPAWPEPAWQDFWHKKPKLKARVTYDRAFHVVTVGDRVYYASSADDQVYCLKADSGEILWTFFTEAPVRLAPTIVNGRVLFGSDDGFVYCLNATDGKLNWKFRLGPTDRRIPGNSRVISVWPVRSGVLVEDNIAYFCAGIFPSQGVYQAAVDIKTGKKLASGSVNVSAQGYLSRRAGRLFVTTGRDPAGSFVAQLARRGKGVSSEIRRIPDDFPYAFIGSAKTRFGGGDGKVAAFRLDDGTKVWSADVDGKAYSMAIAQGCLYVSTDKGKIYCFAHSDEDWVFIEEIQDIGFPFVDSETKRTTIASARGILKRSGIKQGYCLVVGSGDGGLAYELARQSELRVIGLEFDPNQVAASRRALSQPGLYGRVSIHQHIDDGKLPYTDYLFNLIVDNRADADARQNVPRAEIERVLRPHGGVAVLGPNQQDLHLRGPLRGIGEWTHMYADAANTVCSSDEHVGGSMALQWFGPPGPQRMLDRHHRTIAPLSKDGRLFIPGNDRVTAADAYNGTVLWSAEIPNSRRIGVFRDCSYMVAGDGTLYVATDDTCCVLDAETGKRLTTIPLPKSEDGPPRHWGYLANVDDLLIGTAVNPKASRRDHNRKAISDTYYDSRPLVCSDSVFVLDRKTGEPIWSYPAETGLIINPTITVGGGLIFFVESANNKTLKSPNGRAQPSDLLARGSYLVALDMRSGSIVWKEPHDFSAIQHNIYISYAKGKLVVVGSRNDGNDSKKSRVWYDVHAYNARNGEPVWHQTQKQPTEIGGSHGEQDHHPVIVGDRLYCEPFGYELQTGKRLKWKWSPRHRRGCGTISASASTFFFRQSNPTMFDLKTNKYSKVTSTTRPGCWINMIPAGGLLLIPEASSGCTCNFAVQTSLAFLPIRQRSEK